MTGAGDAGPQPGPPEQRDLVVRALAGRRVEDPPDVGDQDREQHPGDGEPAGRAGRDLVDAADRDPQRHQSIPLRRGSSLSRSASPSRFEPSTTTRMATPGTMASRWVFQMKVVPWSSSAPQVYGTCGPRPRNDSDDSIRITPPNPKVIWTSSGPMRLGRMWRRMIRHGPAPMARAAVTYSRSRRASTWPRATRA